MVEQVFLAVCGGLAPEQMDIPEGSATPGKPLPEQRKSVRSGREKLLCTDHCIASLKGLSVTCHHNKREGEESGVKKLSLGKGEQRYFPYVLIFVSIFPHTQISN